MDHPVVFTGEVVRGRQLGQTIGFPTANIIPGDRLPSLLRWGVYAVRASVGGVIFDGMANIGIRPTLEDPTLVLEVNLFGFSGDIYGKKMTVWFYDFLRPEIKFSGLEELKQQIVLDQARVKDLLAMRHKPDADPE
jgi:riboflavin kinase/FMN adenylyltransferase